MRVRDIGWDGAPMVWRVIVTCALAAYHRAGKYKINSVPLPC